MKSSAIVWKYNKLREKGAFVGAADQKINSLNKKTGVDTSKIALNAAAIQDHLMHKMFGSIRPAKINKQKSEPLSQAGKDIIKMLSNPKSCYVEERELERKKQEYIKNLTLAEKLHIVAKPKPPLTTQEWKGIEVQHEKRCEVTDECPICREPFGIRQQVILSCSHVYHKVCLESFERYCSTKVCPVCRKEQYDKKSYNEGIRKYALTLLVKIQAAARGYLVKRDRKSVV